MGCISSASFAVLINESPSSFFRSSRGLHQGCPLSPCLFLLIAEALSRLIATAKSKGRLTGVRVSESKSLSHLLFVDDVLCFIQGTSRKFKSLKNILESFCISTGIEVNLQKSFLYHYFLSRESTLLLIKLLPFALKPLDIGFKYLDFHLKPDNYRKEDWTWLIQKFEARISFWGNRLLSRGERLVLIKEVLESIPVYWNAITKVPISVLFKIKSVSFQFLWTGTHQANGIPLVKWSRVAYLKKLGGWGIKNIYLFSLYLAACSFWCLTKNTTLWGRVLKSKYLQGRSIEE